MKNRSLTLSMRKNKVTGEFSQPGFMNSEDRCVLENYLFRPHVANYTLCLVVNQKCRFQSIPIKKVR